MSNFFLDLKNRFKELWKYEIFRYAVILHGLYLIISSILTLTIFRNQNDFLVYYKVGDVFINNINDLYNRENYLWPFRYLPISAILFVPFYLLGFYMGFIVFNIINLLLNILICVILYKIIILCRGEDHEKDDKRIILYISLFLISLPSLFNYILGQINLYVTLLILLSLLIFLKYNRLKWELLASIILGISIIIKPITIFLIPFLIIIRFKLETKKFEFNFYKSLIRIFGVFIPLSLNFIIFFLYPNLWEDFLTINFTGEEPVIINHSFSITKLISNFCKFYNITDNQSFILFTFAALIVIIGCSGFVIYLIRRFDQNSIIYGYTYGILIMLLIYFDSWDHHLLILTPILIILIFNLPRNSEITKKFIKPSFFFFIFFDLAFMGLWFLTQDWFPFNFGSTIFLLITFFGIGKYCIKKNINNRKN